MAYERKDSFYGRAKSAGYRSRAAFKLQELARRYRLLRKGSRVVDLGAWPGGWLQVAAERVGPGGRVVGVDLHRVDPLPQSWVSCIEGDAADPAVADEILRRAGGPVDAVLSDMSPKLTGVRARDEARAAELAEATLELARRVLAGGGHLVMKTFMSAETSALLAELRRHFRTVKLSRPEASRKGSAETYVVALGFRG
jgi:23S rRNA (uridine2552-2'-O)-methyltransferase